MIWETQKILDDDAVLVNPTCVRVPFFFGHAEAVHIGREAMTAEARAVLEAAPGVEVIGHGTEVTRHPLRTQLERIRCLSGVSANISHPRGLNLWVVADNVRKNGAEQCANRRNSVVRASSR